MPVQTAPTAIFHYTPAPPALGANLTPGALIRVEWVGDTPIEGAVVPGEPSDLHDQLPPEAHEALDRAAVAGAAGESGQVGFELGYDLPW